MSVLELTEPTIETVDEFLFVHGTTVNQVARGVARDFKAVNHEDLEQDLWVVITERFSYFAEARNVRALLNATAKRLANAERIDYMHFTGSYIYTPDDVRTILQDSVWSDIEKAPDVEGRADVRAKYDRLAQGRKDAVYKRFALGFPYKELTEGERKSLNRGVNDIANWLNGALSLKPLSYDEHVAGNPEDGDTNRVKHEANNYLNGGE